MPPITGAVDMGATEATAGAMGGGGVTDPTSGGSEVVHVAAPQRSQLLPGIGTPPCGRTGGGGTLIPFARTSAHWQRAQRRSLCNSAGLDRVFWPAGCLEGGGSAQTAVGTI